MATAGPTPKIVQFAYKNYSSDGKQRKALCKSCNAKITDAEGTTSNFVRHLKKAHKDK